MVQPPRSFSYEDVGVEKEAGLYTLTLPAGSSLDHNSAPGLRQHFIEIAPQPDLTAILVDMTGVASMDSMGIGVLIGGLKRFKSRSGFEKFSVDLTNNERVAKIFRITGIMNIFDVISEDNETIARIDKK
jgi:anti-anti-sigma factor